MRLRVSPDLSLPDDAVTQTFLILGKRGSGKSNTAVVLAEEMHRAGAPFVVLDPISAWWGLKSSFDGKGPGLPVYVFGGPHGDLPLQPTAGELMAQVFIRHRQPMVLDMKGWTGADRARFVTAFAEYLLGHNDRMPSHVFLEEADAFIPQRPYKGEEKMLGTMDRLVRWGRQEGLGSSVISQRSAKINKDVTTQSEVLIAHRTTGPQDRDVIRDWIRYHAGDEELAKILAALPTLADGTAWVWSPEWLNVLKEVRFRRRETFDSASTPKLGEKRVAPKALAPVDLDKLREQLADTIERAKADDPRELKRRITELERQLIVANATERERTVEKIVEKPVPYLEPALRKAVEDKVRSLRTELQRLSQDTGEIDSMMASWDLRNPPPAARPARSRPSPTPDQTGYRPAKLEVLGTSDAWRPPGHAERSPDVAYEGDVVISPTMAAVLNVLAQFPERTQQQVALLSGYSPTSGGYYKALADLRKANYIEGTAKALRITPAGRAAVGEIAPLPSDLLGYWTGRLKPTEAAVLRALAGVHPNSLPQVDVAAAAGYSSTSGGFYGALAKLRKLDLIEGGSSGLRIVDDLIQA